MSAVQDRPTSRQTPLIDRDGNHLQMHGDPAQHCAPNTLRRLGVPVGMQVMTRNDARKKNGPEVILYVADAPFAFDWRMTATEARAMAANLMHAADTADQVATVSAQRTQRKAGA